MTEGGAPEAAGAESNTRPRVALALAVGVGLTVAACNGSPLAFSEATPHSPSRPATASRWATIDHQLEALGPKVGFLAASVSPEGTCHTVHGVDASKPRPLASQFKLFVLGALANQIAAGRISWGQTLTVEDATKSIGNEQDPESLELMPQGTLVSVEVAATKMISISDNTAADMLIGLVGRHSVEAQVRRWTGSASADIPFLTPRELFQLHFVPGLADRYLATPPGQRDAFLTSSVDPLPMDDPSIYSGPNEPRYVEQIEWFASPDGICRAFAGLQRLSKNPRLSPLSTILSLNPGIAMNPSEWPTVWYKGGSEAGVLTLGWLATNTKGKTFVVEAMVSNSDANLSADSITNLVALARSAFGLLG